MTRVDFYLLPGQDAASRLHFTCRLAGQALTRHRRMHILTADENECIALDRLLWTYEDISFIPHAITSASNTHYPVTLGHTQDSLSEGDMLLNLAPDVPPYTDQFSRIAEIIDEDSARKAAGRLHYRTYRDRGYDLRHHHLEPVT